MKIIDARSGKEVVVGTPIVYGDGEQMTVLEVKPGLRSAQALICLVHPDYTGATQGMVSSTAWQPLTVRWLHPGFLFQHVAFVNS